MKRTVTILGGDERMAWLAENLRREGYIIRLAALLPPAPLKNRLPQPETPDRLLPESKTVILAVPTVGPDGMLRTPTVPECYPLAECLRRLPEGAMVLGGTLPPDCRKIVEERHLAYTDLLALPELQELNGGAGHAGTEHHSIRYAVHGAGLRTLRQRAVPQAGGAGGPCYGGGTAAGTAGAHLCRWIYPL